MDSVLLLLLGLLAATLLAFFAGFFPYPYGLIILLAFIAARLFSLLGRDK
jgi:uncharacterized integral membrane protein